MITEEMIQKHHHECEANKMKMLDLGQKPGPWDYEPNRIEGKYRGLPVLMTRNTHTLTWCGYVGVPKGHPFFGKHYDDMHDFTSVHGGLTYSGECAHIICHKDDEAGQKVWWFGFDCAHAWDQMPFDAVRLLPRSAGYDLLDRSWKQNDVYRNMWYVREEVQELAKQVIEGSKLKNRLLVRWARLKIKVRDFYVYKTLRPIKALLAKARRPSDDGNRLRGI